MRKFLFSFVLLSISASNSFAMPHVGEEAYRTPSGSESSESEALCITPNRYQMDKEGQRKILNEEEKEMFKAYIEDGNLKHSYSSDLLKGQYLYFLSTSQELFLFPNFLTYGLDGSMIGHSSFDVITDDEKRTGHCKMAGEMLIIQTAKGMKVMINNDSGHYKPDFSKVFLVVEALKEMGFQGEIETTEETW